MIVGGVQSASLMEQHLKSSAVGTIDEHDFKEKLEQALETSNDEEIKASFDQIEAYMLGLVFKQVKQSMLQEDENALIPKGDYTKMFEDTMIQTVAEEVVQSGGIGLSKSMYEQMQQSYGNQMKMKVDKEGK